MTCVWRYEICIRAHSIEADAAIYLLRVLLGKGLKISGELKTL